MFITTQASFSKNCANILQFSHKQHAKLPVNLGLGR